MSEKTISTHSTVRVESSGLLAHSPNVKQWKSACRRIERWQQFAAIDGAVRAELSNCVSKPAVR